MSYYWNNVAEHSTNPTVKRIAARLALREAREGKCQGTDFRPWRETTFDRTKDERFETVTEYRFKDRCIPFASLWECRLSNRAEKGLSVNFALYNNC